MKMIQESMKIRKEVNFDKVDGTCLQGHIVSGYSYLVELFGPPISNLADYKTDAEWVLEFELSNGTREIATIYNWKNGKNYLGDEGLPVESIREWNIGGRNASANTLVNTAILWGIKAE